MDHRIALTSLHALGQSGILLLESLTNSLRVLEELLGTLQDTALLLGCELLGGEIVDTVSKATLDKVRIETHKVLHLLLLDKSLELLLFSLVQLVHCVILML